MKTYARPLDDNPSALTFLTKVLGFKNGMELGDKIQKIVSAEIMLSKTVAECTLDSNKNRHTYYSTDELRERLRERIFEELILETRLEKDDDIALGKGGVLPFSGLKKEKQAYIITGLPASGKSTIAVQIAEHTGSAIVDSDFAKRKLPEFSQPQGASVVHEESTLITFGGGDDPRFCDEKSVLEYMVSEGANIIIPKIGYTKSSVTDLRDKLISVGYSVHLILVSVDRVVSTTRALNRFWETDRYVPLSLVFDQYANDPALTYYRLKEDSEWTSVGKLNTEREAPVLVASTDLSPLRELWS